MRALSRTSILALLLSSSVAGASIAAEDTAAGGAPQAARIGARLERALTQPMPEPGIGIRVSLRDDDLPRGPARRALVAARQQRALDGLGAAFRLKRRYESISGFAGWAQPQAIRALRNHPEVVSIHLDGEVHANLAQGGPLVGAPEAHTQGFTGAGVNVAVLDTGIDTDHPGLADDLIAQECFCDTHPSPNKGCCPNGDDAQSGAGAAEDDNGHGTSVSGIITSPLGIAPDSSIVAIKVLSSSGTGRDSDVDAALDWVLTKHAALSIRIVNISLSDGGEYNDPNVSTCSGNPTANAIRDLGLEGVAVFAASGNDGHDDGVSAPACSADAISVGGSYDANLGSLSWCGNSQCTTILCSDDAVVDGFVCHSNSDEILDLLAPDWKTTTSALGGGSTSFGGTSAATPYAAAQAALLLQADATLSPADIRDRMTSFGPLVTNPDNGLAFPRTDVSLAIQDLLGTCGNATLEPGEQCDDGNLADGDCCSSGCAFEAADSSCSDADACTHDDVCDGAGGCSGTAIQCDNGNPCTDDSCDPTGVCSFTPNAAVCDDGDACTEADTCSAGFCGGGPVDCDDGNPCTADACDAAAGCSHEPILDCAEPIPAVPGWGRLLVALLVLACGASVLRRRRPERS